MKVTLNNGWEVTPLSGGVPLKKTFYAETADKTVVLCTVKGELQLVYESGVGRWEMASTAMAVDNLQEPLITPITIKAEPLRNEPNE